jgi:hypothetical protein
LAFFAKGWVLSVFVKFAPQSGRPTQIKSPPQPNQSALATPQISLALVDDLPKMRRQEGTDRRALSRRQCSNLAQETGVYADRDLRFHR